MCVRPIICRFQILLNWGVIFILKTNLMIVYFTKNFDVYTLQLGGNALQPQMDCLSP